LFFFHLVRFLLTELRKEYDLGCDPGGFAGAMRAFDFGRHVCIIEGGEIGGAGVKWGALASKRLLIGRSIYSEGFSEDHAGKSLAAELI
jgi:dihydrolipoamide dehydrogenase